MNRIALWILFFVVIGLIIWGTVEGIKKGAKTTGLLKVPVTAQDWQKGATSSDIVLVEYSDFQCPACAAFEPVIKEIVAEFPKLTFVYRHFPLIMIHQNADLAAGASEAAGNQGKFWEMHDLLFEKQKDWEFATTSQIFSDYAATLQLDIEKFNTDITSTETRKKINEMYRGGVQAGVSGTPTFFLNGKQISPKSVDQFKQLIINAIATTTVSQ
ncbi:MAG: DsbA family protein [Candidatus Pacebacteria bacterium]|jgi:protein-disulfide isomerase|nr:DsbA family protein [Candidatus Paceibacterota bacterium]